MLMSFCVCRANGGCHVSPMFMREALLVLDALADAI